MTKSNKLHASDGSMANGHITQESGTGDPLPATESATYLKVRFPLEGERPLSVELRRRGDTVAGQPFRAFGINE